MGSPSRGCDAVLRAGEGDKKLPGLSLESRDIPGRAEAAGGERLSSLSRRGAAGPTTCLVCPSDQVKIFSSIGRSQVTSVGLGALGRAEEPELGPRGSCAGCVSAVVSRRLLLGSPGGVSV